jgi:hypothetical protein
VQAAPTTAATTGMKVRKSAFTTGQPQRAPGVPPP